MHTHMHRLSFAFKGPRGGPLKITRKYFLLGPLMELLRGPALLRRIFVHEGVLEGARLAQIFALFGSAEFQPLRARDK